MAKRKIEPKTENPAKEKAKTLDSFDMTEVYRLIHLEQIPNFQMLKSERKYLKDYRKALKEHYLTLSNKQEEAERIQEVIDLSEEEQKNEEEPKSE